MKKAIVFSLIILGITSIVSQLIVIRELNTSFSGNEFFIGWTLFSWLFWTSIGSLLLNKLVKEEKIFKFLVISNVLIPISLILEISLIRFSRILTTAQAGQIPNLIPALLYGFIILAPLCLILGLQFTIIARLWKYNYQGIELSRAIGKSYILETIGFIIGGLAFSYFLIFINEFYSTSIIAWLNLSAGIFILAYRKITGLKFLSIVLFGFFILIFIFSPFIYYQTSSFRFPNQILIESKNSLYGNIAVTQLKDQYNFYENGLYLGTNKEEILNEYVHIPLLYHRNPKNVLLIGAGFNGIIKEIIKHNPEKIIYLELDYNLIKIAKEHLSNDLSIYLDDKRVKIINADARYFLKNSSEKFDLIIVNLPNPSTALINRFYTDEFYKEAKIHLSENGILSTYLKLSTNYFGPEVENLDASLRKALNNNFDYVLIFPEDQHLFIVSQDKIDYNPNSLIQRLKERNIKTNFVNEEYIEYRLTNDRVKTLNDLLDKNQTAKINQDQLPVSYYYNLIYWVSSFHPKLAKIFQRLGEINFIWIIIFLIVSWFLVLFSSQKKSKNNTQNLLPIAMAIAGFSLMAIEIIIIFGFQIFYGYLYYKISLIISALMTGMALGSWLANRKLEQKSIKSVIKIHTLIIVFSLILLFGFYSLFRISLKPSIFIEITFLIATGLIGTIVGFEFPVINRLYLENKNNTSKKTGVIYGADLIGSCLGALLASIFFIPIFGIYQALILLGILNFLIIIPLIISRLRRQKPEQ